MKRLKRVLSVAKPAPSISESISEIDEYLKDTHLESRIESDFSNGELGSGNIGNNNTREGKSMIFLNMK